MDSVSRPEWAEVATFERHQASAAVRSAVEEAGFVVVAEENGLSVRRNATRQVACYALTAAGHFRWGWVESQDGNGRTDYYDFAVYLAALKHRQQTPN